MSSKLSSVIPHYTMEFLSRYFRLTFEGLEHIPSAGKALVCPNHSGFSGYDAMLIAHLIRSHLKRAPLVLTHRFWFFSQWSTLIAEQLGFVEATALNGLHYLNENEIVILFPEGEYGNFKPTSKAYHLQEFKRGFIRMALKTQSPIIPTVVIGAEESNINLSRIKLPSFLAPMVIPLPFNLIPFPAKWKIKFLEPIYFPFNPEAADDRDLVHELSIEVKEKMQKNINYELKKRHSIF